MSLLLMIAISTLVGGGVYLLLSRDLFRLVLGLTLLGTAANLVVFFGGWPGSLVPPVITPGEPVVDPAAPNPMPQALVLTAIVIGFALLCYALVLAARVSREQGHSDISRYQSSEPHTGADASAQDPLKPPILEDEVLEDNQ